MHSFASPLKHILWQHTGTETRCSDGCVDKSLSSSSALAFAPPNRFGCDWHSVLSAPPRRRAEKEGELSRAEPSGAEPPMGAEASCCCREEREITCPSPLSHIHTELQLTERKLNHFYAETMPQALFQEPQYGELVHVAEALTERERELTKTQVHSNAWSAQPFLNHTLTHFRASRCPYASACNMLRLFECMTLWFSLICTARSKRTDFWQMSHHACLCRTTPWNEVTSSEWLKAS